MSDPDFETWPESAQTKRVPQQPGQQRSEVVRNFDREDWKEMRQIISDQSAAIAERDATIATLQEAVMLLKKRNYAKEDEIAALQARVTAIQKLVAEANECHPTKDNEDILRLCDLATPTTEK